MAGRIEDYGLIGDLHTTALVGRDGSIDWLCLPRIDSGACFAALLGDEDNGRWRIAPVGGRPAGRRYRDGTLVLETDLECPEGAVRIVDFMPPRDDHHPRLVRLVQGLRGRVPVRMELAVRFDYGSIVPWVRRMDGPDRYATSLVALAGADALYLDSEIATHGEGFATVGDAVVGPGERRWSVLTWGAAHEAPPDRVDPEPLLDAAEGFWRGWSGRSRYDGEWPEAVERSLITLKALTYAPTGGVVAAPTTSLPELIGGGRNWDYRFCWLRDASFTLYALSLAGYEAEAVAWRDWLVRAVAGQPERLQVMYGVTGNRRLTELELGWLSGYEASRPVRIGNGAHDQLQLDTYGELIDALHIARRFHMRADRRGWDVEVAVLDWLESNWREPDNGIWEVRGDRRHFTHSKVMAWVAMDRAVKGVERFGLDGPVDRWRRLRQEIHAEVCAHGVDPERGNFTQSYGSRALDAALLMLPLVGFIRPTDPRMRATVEAIQRELTEDGLVLRYRTEHPDSDDGLAGREGTFLACSFWLVDNLALSGRQEEGRALFERLLGLRNDLGLLAEEYDPVAARQLGNFPQAFSHVGLVNAAHNLSGTAVGPAADRPDEGAA